MGLSAKHTFKHHTYLGGAVEGEIKMNSNSLLVVLLFFSAGVWLSQSDPPVGKACKEVGTEPQCVCHHPKGTIDLRPLSSNDGPRCVHLVLVTLLLFFVFFLFFLFLLFLFCFFVVVVFCLFFVLFLHQSYCLSGETLKQVRKMDAVTLYSNQVMLGNKMGCEESSAIST